MPRLVTAALVAALDDAPPAVVVPVGARGSLALLSPVRSALPGTRCPCSGPTLTGGPGAWGGDGKGTTDGGDDGGYFSGPNLVGGARAGAAPWGASPGPFMHQQYPQQYPQQYQQQQQYQPQQGGLRMGQYHGRRSSGVSAGPGLEAEAGGGEREKTACWRPPEVSLPTRWQLSLSVPGAVLDMTDLSWRRLPRGQQVSCCAWESARSGCAAVYTHAVVVGGCLTKLALRQLLRVMQVGGIDWSMLVHVSLHTADLCSKQAKLGHICDAQDSACSLSEAHFSKGDTWALSLFSCLKKKRT